MGMKLTTRLCFPQLGNRMNPASRSLCFITGSSMASYARTSPPSLCFPSPPVSLSFPSISFSLPQSSTRVNLAMSLPSHLAHTSPIYRSPALLPSGLRPFSSVSRWTRLHCRWRQRAQAAWLQLWRKTARGQVAQIQGDILACAAALACVLI